MDGQAASFNRNVRQLSQKKDVQKRTAQNDFRKKATQEQTGAAKYDPHPKKTAREVTSKDCEGVFYLEDDEDENELGYFKNNRNGDSDYQFSQEIMEHNSKQETRRGREKGKLSHLSIFDWMIKTSSLLRLSKQTVYRGVIIIKKFMFLDQKSLASRVTISNANLYALAALLISNKFQNFQGNFLLNVTHIEGLEKERILECQLYIMTTLQFHLPSHIYIVQSLLEVVQIWNELVLGTPLSKYNLNRCDQLVQIWSNSQKGNEEQQNHNSQKELLQVFVYLIDFVMMRKIVELRIKDFKVLESSLFFKKVIVNVLYHLASFLISRSNDKLQVLELKTFRNVFQLLAEKLQLQRSDLAILQRKSHLLTKEIRAMFGLASVKTEYIHKVSERHGAIEQGYCLCRVAAMSIKYLDKEQLAERERLNQDALQQEIRLSHHDDENDTNLFNQPPSRQKTTQAQTISRNPSKSPTPPVRICKDCIKDDKLLREILNSQFYLPLLISKSSGK